MLDLNSNRLNPNDSIPTEILDVGKMNPLMRIVDRDQPANQILANIWTVDRLPIYRRSSIRHIDPQHNGQSYLSEVAKVAQGNSIVDIGVAKLNDDYTLIDPTLQLDNQLDSSTFQSNNVEPKSDLGYAGLTPSQRMQFTMWLTNPDHPAPLAYQHLYIAHLEVRLLERGAMAAKAHMELERLQDVPAWRGQEMVARALMLSYWLDQDREGMARWAESGKVPTKLLGILLGWRGLLGLSQPLYTKISPADLTVIAASWQLSRLRLDEDVIKLHLDSFQKNLKIDSLLYALSLLPDERRHPQPWRCVHRDLRISLPQPDLRPELEPLLRDLLDAVADETEYYPRAVDGRNREQNREQDSAHTLPPESPAVDDLGWHLILEFSESRSVHFDHALQWAKKMSTFTQIMDEKRNIIYRVTYQKKHLQKFWPVWSDVRKWSGVKVYVNGEEIAADKVNSYSSPFFD